MISILSYPVLLMPLLLEHQPQVPIGPPAQVRAITLSGGFGNSLAWVGAQLEWHVFSERLSVIGAAGYTPKIDSGDPSGVTFAAGVRVFTNGARHRGFLELSITQVAIEGRKLVGPGIEIDLPAEERFYGPGIQAGWQYTAHGGFTLATSAGAGYALGKDEDIQGSAVQPLFSLGLGYTWRR